MLDLFFKIISLPGAEVRTLPPLEGEGPMEWASRVRTTLELRALAASERLGDRVGYAVPAVDEKGVRFENFTLTPEGIVVKTRRATVLIRHEADRAAAEALRAAVWAEGVGDGLAGHLLKVAVILDPERVEDFEACLAALNSPAEEIARLLRETLRKAMEEENWDDPDPK